MKNIYAQYENEKLLQVINILTSKEKGVCVSELIEFRNTNNNFVLSVPHSGLYVPLKFKNYFKSLKDLLLEVDMFTDKLFGNCGGKQLYCRLAPFFVNMIEKRNTALHYTTINNEKALEKQYSEKEKQEITKYYDLYHHLLRALIEKMKSEKDYAFLIDGHSMIWGDKDYVDYGNGPFDFVIGNLYGKSCNKNVFSAFYKELKAKAKKFDMSVALNKPYAGGFITKKYGIPKENKNAIQLEINIDTYLKKVNKKYRIKKENMKNIQEIISSAIKIANQQCKEIY